MYIKIIFSFFFFLFLHLSSINYLIGATRHTYVENSVLAKGKWVKIRVAESGIYKLTYDEIRNMGFSNPSNIRVFGYGGAILEEDFREKKIDDLPEIAIYDGGSYILFYAQGAIKWNYNKESKNCKFNFTINPYSNYGYYFLTTSAGIKKRIVSEPEENGENLIQVKDFVDYAKIKKEELNYVSSGRVWYGDAMKSGESKNYQFSFPNINKEKEMQVQVCAAVSPPSATRMSVTCSGETGVINFSTSSSNYVIASESSVFMKMQPSAENISLTLRYIGSSSSDKAALNYVTVNTYRQLIMSGTFMPFRNYDCIGSNNYSCFTLKKASSNVKIWNITLPDSITEVPAKLSGDSLQFVKKTNGLLEFVAVNPLGQFPSPEVIGVIENQNLHALSSIDFVIISHPDFLSQACRLAEVHKEQDQLNVAVVTPEQIYNEFSSGTPDATAYRWLMKMLYDREGGSKYLLLFGDGCYDNKGILATKFVPARNYILTFQSATSLDRTRSFVSDDYFGFLGDYEGIAGNYGNAVVDIGIGRFPVASLSEATAVVDKAIAYMENKNKGSWKNRICLVADDNEGSSSSSPSSISFNKFFNYSEQISNIIHDKNPGMEIKKLYFDAFTRVVGSNGARFPEVESLLTEEINSGVLFLNYIGHSGSSGWSAEHVFTQTQAANLYNKNLGFWFTASCEFTQFDDLSNSGGEDLFLNPNGGAIAVYSSARTVYDGLNDKLNQALIKVLFNRDEEGRSARIGDIYKWSKQDISNDTNKMSFVLLADPVLRLTYPDLLVQTDSITFIPEGKTDTIKALSEVIVYGRIEDEEKNFVPSFNGKMRIVVYDKEQTLYTKGNVYTSEEEKLKNRFEYKDRPNVLFTGETEVEEGYFSFVFKVPKDINYSYGFGRINYYAYDDINNYEAQGSYESFIVGGSNDDIKYETEGPEVTLYLNTESFISGDKVNESPVLYAYIKDENGINASSSGIGHDITLTLSGLKEPVVLNSYFAYSLKSYKEGTLAYQMENLSDGKYTLSFKVWDLLNNSTTKQIDFEVINGLPVNIENVVAYPNPAKEFVSFRILHDRPETLLSYKVKIYDLNGVLVYASEDKKNTDSGVLSLDWNLRSSLGVRVKSGIYIYRIETSTTEGEYIGKSQKIMVLPQ